MDLDNFLEYSYIEHNTNKIRDLFKVKLNTIRSETKKKREVREREKKEREKKEKK